jgi:hypothetical protein
LTLHLIAIKYRLWLFVPISIGLRQGSESAPAD